MSDGRLVYSTWPDADSAETAARAVVAMKLAACANILPGAVSIFEWEGKTMRDPECIMLLKTTEAAARKLVEALVRQHPYDTPAVSVVPLERALSHGPFMDWLSQTCG